MQHRAACGSTRARTAVAAGCRQRPGRAALLHHHQHPLSESARTSAVLSTNSQAVSARRACESTRAAPPLAAVLPARRTPTASTSEWLDTVSPPARLPAPTPPASSTFASSTSAAGPVMCSSGSGAAAGAAPRSTQRASWAPTQLPCSRTGPLITRVALSAMSAVSCTTRRSRQPSSELASAARSACSLPTAMACSGAARRKRRSAGSGCRPAWARGGGGRGLECGRRTAGGRVSLGARSSRRSPVTRAAHSSSCAAARAARIAPPLKVVRLRLLCQTKHAPERPLQPPMQRGWSAGTMGTAIGACLHPTSTAAAAVAPRRH